MEEKNKALQFAMKLIGLRRRSEFEIRERLKQKNFSEEISEETISELKKYKYLDDEKFAESYINDRINLRPCGKRLIKMELARKGVSENIIENKLDELLSFEKELELAEKIIAKKLRIIGEESEKNKLRQKLMASLQLKGFSFDIISKALDNKL